MNKWYFEIDNQGKISYKFEKKGKFIDDKIEFEDDEYILILDGVIFNKLELMKYKNTESWSECIIKMYEDDIEFFGRLRGSFNGVIFEKKSENLISFTNHTGERAVFYSKISGKQIIISSDFNEIYKYFIKNKIKYNQDINAIKFMITYGFMLNNVTYIEEIRRLMPGSYVTNQNIGVKYYHIFGSDKEKNFEDEDEIIEEIDRKFRQAIRRQFDKDKEYGYKSLVDISGGLDSRTINYVAKDMGYKNILNISYSQINSYEQEVTEMLVKDLGFDYIYKSLDNASFIYELDEIIEKNYGLSIYSGITGGKQLLESLNMDKYGLEHTGLLGDVADGTFEFKNYHTDAKYDDKYRFSNVLNKDILPKEILKNYLNQEMFYFYTRGMLGGACTHFIRRNYIETFSPFSDVDFLTLSHQIDLKTRYDNRIFRKWITKKYPDATKIVYDKTMCDINSSKARVKLEKIKRKLIPYIKSKIGIELKEEYSKGMNPYEYWYENSQELRDFIKEYFEENLERVESKDIQNLIKEVYEKGKVIDKMCVLTALGAIKKYFKDGE